MLSHFTSLLLCVVASTSAQYHTVTDLGQPNPDAALGNPMRGLMESPDYTWPPYDSQVPLSLEFYYVGMYLTRMRHDCIDSARLRIFSYLHHHRSRRGDDWRP